MLHTRNRLYFLVVPIQSSSATGRSVVVVVVDINFGHSPQMEKAVSGVAVTSRGPILRERKTDRFYIAMETKSV